MSQEWFVIRAGKEAGPFSAQQIKEQVMDGKLVRGDLIRRGDMKSSTKASNIKGLFPAVVAKAQLFDDSFTSHLATVTFPS